jgi:hypothetical protein
MSLREINGPSESASEVLRALTLNDRAHSSSAPAKGLTLKKSSLPSAEPLKIEITHPIYGYFGQQWESTSRGRIYTLNTGRNIVLSIFGTVVPPYPLLNANTKRFGQRLRQLGQKRESSRTPMFITTNLLDGCERWLARHSEPIA